MHRFGALFLGALVLSGDAWASSVAGCRYEAEVKAIAEEKGAITLDLTVLSAEPFDHSGAPATCAEAGEALSFAPDDDPDVRAAGVAPGDRIRVETADVRNGKKHFQQYDFLEKLPAPEPPVAEPAAEPLPAEPPAAEPAPAP